MTLTDVNSPQPERDSETAEIPAVLTEVLTAEDADGIAIYTVPDEQDGEPHETVPAQRSRHRASGSATHRKRSRTPLVMVSALVASAGLGSAVALLQRPDTVGTTDPASSAPSRIVDAPRSLTESPVPLAPEASDRRTARATSAPTSSAGDSVGGSEPRVTATSGTREAEQNRSAQVQDQTSTRAPMRISDLADRPTRAGDWPAITYTLQASASSDEPLRFPTSVPGYRLTASAVSRVELSESRFFTPVGRLPVRTASYDDCKQKRFYARWITVDPHAVVESSFVDEAVATLQNQPVSGSAGWQSSYGCVQPALRIRPGTAGPDQASVIVETETWTKRG